MQFLNLKDNFTCNLHTLLTTFLLCWPTIIKMLSAGYVSELNVTDELKKQGLGPLEPGPVIILSVPLISLPSNATIAAIQVPLLFRIASWDWVILPFY